MEKIQDKAQDLVDGAIPHISAAQQGAISLMQLRRNIETLSSSVDQQRCRLAYFQATAVLKDNILFNTPSLQFKRDELLVVINRLWKQRILIDQLRSNVHNSLHYMDMLAFLIVSEQPDLFHDIDLKQGDYIDIYRTGVYNRDLKDIHHYYYSIFAERLSPSFNRKEFIRAHPYPIEHYKSNENEHQLSLIPKSSLSNSTKSAQEAYKNHFNSQNSPSQSNANESLQNNSYVGGNNQARDNSAYQLGAEVQAGGKGFKGDEPVFVNNKELQVVDSLVGKSIANIEGQAYAEAKNIIEQGTNGAQSLPIGHRLGKRDSYSKAKEMGSDELNDDWLDKLLQEHSAMGSHKHARYFPKDVDPEILAIVAACHNALLLDYYSQELERFDPIWDIYLKQQREYSNDLMFIVRKLEALAEDFTYSELHSLHQELSDITYLASETKPMVMVTIGFSLIGFWIVIYFLNRLIMQPLRIIARILIKFRYTKEVNLARYEEFFKRQHLVEVREVIDVLPKIFEEFAHMTENSNVLKKRYDELVTYSKYDALTRVFNRGSLNVLIKELDSNTPANFAILMMDIDFFKLLNNSMGHQRGDEVLFAVAQTIQHNLAKKDLVYRYGGEEFCVILSDVNQENAFKVADRLCRTVEALQLKNEGVVSGIVTVSIGLSLVTERPNQFRIEELINQADRALYEAKHAGRNRVHACDESTALAAQGINVTNNQGEESQNESGSFVAPEHMSASANELAELDSKQQISDSDINAKEILSDKESLDDMVHAMDNKHDLLVHEVKELSTLDSSFPVDGFVSTISIDMVNNEPKPEEAAEQKNINSKFSSFFYSVFNNKYKESDDEYFKRQKDENKKFSNMPAYFYFLSNEKNASELREEQIAQKRKEQQLKNKRERYKKKSSKPTNTISKHHAHGGVKAASASAHSHAQDSELKNARKSSALNVNSNHGHSLSQGHEVGHARSHVSAHSALHAKAPESKVPLQDGNSSANASNYPPALLINSDYFNKEGQVKQKDIKLSQDGRAYEFSLTASDLAKEVEYKKEYIEKINEVLAENDPSDNSNLPVAKIKEVRVNNDVYAELSFSNDNQGANSIDKAKLNKE